MQDYTEATARKLGRPLNQLEQSYVKMQYAKLKTPLTQNNHSAFINVMIEDIENPAVMKQYAASNQLLSGVPDIHSYLKKEVEKTTEIKKDINHKATSVAVDSLFGTRDQRSILGMFNPGALTDRAYVLLDRKYAIENPDRSSFQWSITPNAGPNSLITKAQLSHVVGFKMYPFKFPNSANVLTFASRLSISIDEIVSQAYTSPEGRRFHFLFNVAREGSDVLDPYIVNDVGQNTANYTLAKSITTLDTITISFGNPLQLLKLDPYKTTATISAVGVQTQLSFSHPHRCLAGSLVYITGFNTADPAADSIEIELLNSDTGHPIASITSTTMLINVDLSGLSGAITGIPIIYLDSKRFMIPLEIVYCSDAV